MGDDTDDLHELVRDTHAADLDAERMREALKDNPDPATVMREMGITPGGFAPHHPRSLPSTMEFYGITEADIEIEAHAEIDEADFAIVEDEFGDAKLKAHTPAQHTSVADYVGERGLSTLERAELLVTFAARVGVERMEVNGIRIYRTPNEEETDDYVAKHQNNDGEWTELIRVDADLAMDDPDHDGLKEVLISLSYDWPRAYEAMREG